MFTTFVSMPSTAVSSASTSPEPPPRPRPRQKRSQVAKACDWCRVHRIKCDNDHPCNNCKSRGGNCSNSGALKQATLPHAYREIERLKQRVQELEAELKKERENEKPIHQLHTPPSSSPPARLHDREFELRIDPDLTDGAAKRFWEGIHISTARSPQKTWYGSSSLYYFIGRINTFLTSTMHPDHSTHRMLPNSASKLLDGPTTLSREDSDTHNVNQGEESLHAGEFLTPTQEEYFLELFWQSYYTAYPILDEGQFKEHYHSLWTDSDKERKPSALVDIVIAICMQYGMALLPGVGRGLSAASRAAVMTNDATIAGRWHYRRCQTLLAGELEAPTISTLQCHILCSIYLCCGSFQNMADNACAQAARTAYMLGLHLEPPAEMPRREKEMRKRLWWTLYVLESKMSMKLGRPFLLHDDNTTCGLPSDDREIALISGSSFALLGENVTWLTWSLHNAKLILAARTAYTAFYDCKAPSIANVGNGQTIWDDLQTLGAYADLMAPHSERIDEWLRGVPLTLKTKRLNGGVPFSTDRTPLDIEQFAPLWLQRQRLLLELMYHNLSANLFRQFIIFSPNGPPTSLSDSNATKCAAHAMALTHMMHQVLSTTSILAGWHEAFQWQWNSAMTLVGFVLAYPQGATTPAARIAIDISVAVFENFGNSFAQAASAANIMRDLSAKVDYRIEQSMGRLNLTQNNLKQQSHQEELHIVTTGMDSGYESLVDSNFSSVPSDGSLTFDDEAAQEMQAVLAQSIDMTFDVDTYNDFDMLWSNMGGNFIEC